MQKHYHRSPRDDQDASNDEGRGADKKKGVSKRRVLDSPHPRSKVKAKSASEGRGIGYNVYLWREIKKE